MLYRHVPGYHNLALTIVSPYGLFVSMARFLDHAARSYDLTWTMMRPHTLLVGNDIQQGTKTLRGQWQSQNIGRYYDLTPHADQGKVV